VLRNDSTFGYFILTKGIRQGCPFSPLLFLLILKGLSSKILEAKRIGAFKRYKYR
jgi:hypothetical protein